MPRLCSAWRARRRQTAAGDRRRRRHAARDSRRVRRRWRSRSRGCVRGARPRPADVHSTAHSADVRRSGARVCAGVSLSWRAALGTRHTPPPDTPAARAGRLGRHRRCPDRHLPVRHAGRLAHRGPHGRPPLRHGPRAGGTAAHGRQCAVRRGEPSRSSGGVRSSCRTIGDHRRVGRSGRAHRPAGPYDHDPRSGPPRLPRTRRTALRSGRSARPAARQSDRRQRGAHRRTRMHAHGPGTDVRVRRRRGTRRRRLRRAAAIPARASRRGREDFAGPSPAGMPRLSCDRRGRAGEAAAWQPQHARAGAARRPCGIAASPGRSRANRGGRPDRARPVERVG